MAVNEQLVLTGVRFFGVLQEALDWLVRGRAFVNWFRAPMSASWFVV